MINLRDTPCIEAGILDEKTNRFYGKGVGVLFEVRQPRKKDEREHRRLWKKLSPYTFNRYRRYYVDQQIYDPKYRCRLPLYRGEIPGFVPFIMVIDDKIVGFSDMMFKYGRDLWLHKLEDDEVGCSMNLCVLDRYQGLGIGSFYANISVFIAKHFGADYALGYTPTEKGMMNIRLKDGWEYMGVHRKHAVIRKRL